MAELLCENIQDEELYILFIKVILECTLIRKKALIIVLKKGNRAMQMATVISVKITMKICQWCVTISNSNHTT